METSLTLPARAARGVPVLLGALTVLAFAGTILLLMRYTSEQNAIRSLALSDAQAQASAAAVEIDAFFADVMVVANNLAEELSSGALPYDQVQERLRTVALLRSDLDGIAITFEPYVYDPGLELYQHYVYRDKGTVRTLDGATYDYTTPPNSVPDAPQTAWYHNPLENGPMWNEPFLATGARKILIEYGVPFYRVGATERSRSTAAGVLTIDYSVQNIRLMMASLRLGETGYGFVFSPTGTFLAHPIPEYVVNQSIFRMADAMGSADLNAAAQLGLRGQQVQIDWLDPVTDRQSWTFFEPLASTGWVMGVVLNRAEFDLDGSTTAQYLVSIAALGLTALFLMVMTIAAATHTLDHNLWGISGIFSLLCVLLIILSWVITRVNPDDGGVQIADTASLNRYIETYTRSSGVASQPIAVPTGIMVQAVEFTSATNVVVNGYIWQSYPTGREGETILRGFNFPDRLGEEATLEEVDRQIVNDRELIVWYFGVTLQQSFDPSLFPFDTRNIEIRLTPLDLDDPIILTPDFASYNLLSPRLLPGVAPAVSINNWELQSSFFSYERAASTTTFGLPARASAAAPPELFFTISTYRSFLGPFIAYLLPALVVALMLFGWVLNDHDAGDKNEISAALNFGAALFFVLAVAHAALRDSIGAIGMTYLEYLYILLYLAIVTMAGNTYLVVRRPDWAIVSFRDNLPVKLGFFPVMTGVMMIVTLVAFL
ncbi:MAG: Cache 3/Cache 2 fusion domain-containing protein [bacterium]|nr:Cache 3/Cache 2 fusion domain-containing protein [bacterium]